MKISLPMPPKPVGHPRATSRPLKASLVARERVGSDDHSTYARAQASLVLGTGPERPRARSEADGSLPPGWATVPVTRCTSGRGYAVAAYQSIGDRKTQEDRFTLVPRLDPSLDIATSFFGVFDGTVGDFASNTVKDLVVPKLLESPSWKACRSSEEGQERLLVEAFQDMY
ncbi:unnamed protein product, partial [Effrenium voratum]